MLSQQSPPEVPDLRASAMVRAMNEISSDNARSKPAVSAPLPDVPRDYLSMAHAYGGPEHEGRIRCRLEDFQVVEDLGFEPSGDGHHLFVRVRKRGANTQWIAQRIARAAGVPVQKVGYAGMKDRVAVSEQTFSLHLPGKPDPDFSAIEDGELDRRRDERYAGWEGEQRILDGEVSLQQLHDAVLDDESFDPQPVSGRQELLENLVARHIERAR